MSVEVRGHVRSSTPHPTMGGLRTITVTIPATTAVRAGETITLVIPEADPYARSADL